MPDWKPVYVPFGLAGEITGAVNSWSGLDGAGRAPGDGILDSGTNPHTPAPMLRNGKVTGMAVEVDTAPVNAGCRFRVLRDGEVLTPNLLVTAGSNRARVIWVSGHSFFAGETIGVEASNKLGATTKARNPHVIVEIQISGA